jgi:outer membrane protein OmpA-like peptidoglycan-associated protein
MALKYGAVSLVALMLVAGAAWAQDATTDANGNPVAQTDGQAQPDGQAAAPADTTVPADATATDAAPAIPDEVLALLNDETPLAQLDANELQRRMRSARAFARLQDVASAAKAELDARDAASQSATDAPSGDAAPPAKLKPVERKKTQGQVQQTEDQPATGETQQGGADAPTPDANTAVDAGDAGLPRPLVSLLSDDRPLGNLSDEDLQNRLRMARAMAKRKGLPTDVVANLEAIAAAADAEVKQRAGGAAASQTQNQPADQPTKTDASQGAPANPPTADANPQKLDAGPVSPEAEKNAKAFLADGVDPNSLSDDDLRNRLDAMRNLLADNELSLPMERALRKELSSERDILRARIEKVKAAEEAKKAADEAAIIMQTQQQNQPQANGQPNKMGGQAGQGNGKRGPKIVIVPQITINTPVPEILRDRRRSDQLTDEELRRRIEVYRDVRNNNNYDNYSEEDRSSWNDAISSDRDMLHRRLVDERRRRAQEMASGQDFGDGEEELDVQDTFKPGRRVPRNVFEAEADDAEIADVLVAPPKRKVSRRYTVDEIASSPELRDAMPRIEIDTIHFGFNEAFVREEEINNLDRIASIMERVLRKYPREVFLIEGHTDAVGSDMYNLKLSRARAEAVKRALSTYYVIPAQNLKAAGLGERYLKIPTADPEPENRRVSISRATPLLGEAQD